jgi:hypothetical protein
MTPEAEAKRIRGKGTPGKEGQRQNCTPRRNRKNSDAFTGEYLKFQDEIVQIMEDGTQADIRLSVTKESYRFSMNDIIYVTYHGTKDFIKCDIITVYGESQGSHSYESTPGYNITLPLIEANIIE